MSSVGLKTSKKVTTSLLKKFKPGPERGGFILKNGKIIELDNVADDPVEGCSFDLKPEHLEFIPFLAATWHTHPEATANLSVGDSDTFVAWGNLLHAIVGEDGIRWYAVRNGAVINHA